MKNCVKRYNTTQIYKTVVFISYYDTSKFLALITNRHLTIFSSSVGSQCRMTDLKKQ